jgi:hypothetical protein
VKGWEKLKPALLVAGFIVALVIIVALIFGLNRPAEGGAMATILSIGGAILLGRKGEDAKRKAKLDGNAKADAVAPGFDAKEEEKHVDAGRKTVLDSRPDDIVGGLDDSTRSGIDGAIDAGKRAGIDAAREALHRGGGAGGG